MVKDLVFVTPESVGIKSSLVEKFIDKINARKINMHSFMMVKDGKIFAEGYYKPFDKDFKHRLYSCSKTYVSIAIGMLYTEGKIKLDDKIIDFFPEYKKDKINKWLDDYTIEHALMMSAPQEGTTYSDLKTPDWVWTVFCKDMFYRPSGAVWAYNTSATFILCAIVERVTGKHVLEYMRPLLDELGIAKDIWGVKSPDGYEWLGSGVVTTMRDFAKFGEFILNKGSINGKQLVAREYMERATSKLMPNRCTNTYSPIHSCGYGYQIWVTEHGYALSGMGGQFVFCFPEKNFMFVCNADTQGNGAAPGDYVYEKVVDFIYENISAVPLAENEKEYASLTEKLNNLTIEIEYGEKHSKTERIVSGQKYTLVNNRLNWKWLRFDFGDDKGKLTYENERGVKEIEFGYNEFIKGAFPETHYADRVVQKPANRGLDCISSAGWTSENILVLRVFIVDSFIGNLFIQFGFRDDGGLGITASKNAEFFLDDYWGCAGGEKE